MVRVQKKKYNEGKYKAIPKGCIYINNDARRAHAKIKPQEGIKLQVYRESTESW